MRALGDFVIPITLNYGFQIPLKLMLPMESVLHYMKSCFAFLLNHKRHWAVQGLNNSECQCRSYKKGTEHTSQSLVSAGEGP